MRRENQPQGGSSFIQPDLWCPLQGNTIDVVSGNSGVLTGTLSYSDKGAYFNSGVYLTFSSNEHNVITPSWTQSMTFLCDFYNTSTSGHNAVLVFQNGTSRRFVFIVYNNRKIAVEKIGSSNVVVQSNNSCATNALYKNSGFTWNADSHTLSLIINGEIVSTQNVSALPDYSNPEIKIGFADSNNDCFKGYLRNVRIYHQTFDPNMNLNKVSQDEHTLLLLTGDDLIDKSQYEHTITNTNVSINNTNACYKNCYYFNGSAKLNVDIGDKKITDGKFTLEMWVKLSNTTKSYKCISDFCDHSTFYFDASDNRDGTLILMNGNASWQANGSYIYPRSKGVLLSTNWMHVAIVGNDNGHNYLYLNGIKQTGNYFESCTNIMHMSNGKIQFGNIALNMSRYLQGYLEEIRFSNVVRYTSNFTPQSFR